MKNTRIFSVSFLFVLCVIVLCIGCGESDEVYIDAWIKNVCISEKSPVEVQIHLSGMGGDGCGRRPFKNIYVDRVGNRIILEPTAIASHYTGGYTCSSFITYYGDITLKDLDVGEYEIRGTSGASVWLRIEERSAFVRRSVRIKEITLEVKTSEGIKRFEAYPRPLIAVPDPLIETDGPVQVTMGVKGIFDVSEIEDLSKITSIKRVTEEMTVKIPGEVQIINCLQDLSHWYDTEIDLGLFEPGDYRVNVYGHEVRFSIRPDLPPKQDR